MFSLPRKLSLSSALYILTFSYLNVMKKKSSNISHLEEGGRAYLGGRWDHISPPTGKLLYQGLMGICEDKKYKCQTFLVLLRE